jgi:hypothetical protein
MLKTCCLWRGDPDGYVLDALLKPQEQACSSSADA